MNKVFKISSEHPFWFLYCKNQKPFFPKLVFCAMKNFGCWNLWINACRLGGRDYQFKGS